MAEMDSKQSKNVFGTDVSQTCMYKITSFVGIPIFWNSSSFHMKKRCSIWNTIYCLIQNECSRHGCCSILFTLFYSCFLLYERLTHHFWLNYIRNGFAMLILIYITISIEGLGNFVAFKSINTCYCYLESNNWCFHVK